MTLFHELLNKKGRAINMVIGKPIMPNALGEGEPADMAARLQEHTVHRLREDPHATFEGSRPKVGTTHADGRAEHCDSPLLPVNGGKVPAGG